MKNKKIKDSFKYAFSGIMSAFKTEKNMKVHMIAVICVIVFGLLLKLNLLEWIICISCFVLVIGGELFNTAIEVVVDLVSPGINEKAKKSKDIAAGGVLVFAIGSLIIGLLIFVPKIVNLFVM